ncbi:hypothetical protein ACPPVQ_05935 [Diaminobutyricibacter sp. McL0618]|uniref:hypothetical protein n=1 Tax=Leifsonia sp. McL0618 TaxID=3415677 RepID=UPI003CF0A27A
MTQPPTTRHNDDRFRGDGDHSNDPAVDELYRAHGMEPPWKLLWEDGHPVLGPDGKPLLVVPVQRAPAGRSERYWAGD